MATETEKKELEHLANIEQELREIKELSPTLRRSFWSGVLQGAGVLVGSVAAVVLIGYVLSLFGFIPELHEFALYLQGVVNQYGR